MSKLQILTQSQITALQECINLKRAHDEKNAQSFDNAKTFDDFDWSENEHNKSLLALLESVGLVYSEELCDEILSIGELSHRNAIEISVVYLDGVKYARITPIRHPNQFMDIEWHRVWSWLDKYDMFTGDDLSDF